MSASPVFSSAATGRPFIFSLPSFSHLTAEIAAAETAYEKTAKKTAEILAQVGASPKLASVVPAARLGVRPAPEMVSSGIPQLDSLTGGLARGCLTEICGAASSGRTSVLLSALARATERGEVCALVDASDAFDPASAAAAGMELGRLLWVRCEKKSPQGFREGHDFSRAVSSAKSLPALAAEGSRTLQRRKSSRWTDREAQRWESQLGQMLKVTDLLLQSHGFGMIALDLGDVPTPDARRIPLASWFRFRRAIEHTPTVLLVVEQQPIAGSCSSALVRVSGKMKKLSDVSSQLSGNPSMHSEPPHSELLDQFEITVELLRSRMERKPERKPMQSTASFRSRAAWAG
jgi:recA bacterial DNA recombination protein